MSDCKHKHTGSHSPDGIYLSVHCMDCDALLAISDVGRKQLSTCKGFVPGRLDKFCRNCDFLFWDHYTESPPKTKEIPPPQTGERE